MPYPHIFVDKIVALLDETMINGYENFSVVGIRK